MHQLDKPNFARLSQWQRFVRTGDSSGLRHFRDIHGFRAFNDAVCASGGLAAREALLRTLNDNVPAELFDPIRLAGESLFHPAWRCELTSADASLHENGIQVVMRLRLDSTGGEEATSGWRSLYFGPEMCSHLDNTEFTYERYFQYAVLRSFTKSFRSSIGQKQRAHQTMLDRLKPERHELYAVFLKQWDGSSQLPWGM